MRILQVSTWRVPCGIAGYTEDLARALEAGGARVEVAALDRERMRYMTLPELRKHFRELAKAFPGHDVIHLQHEFGFYGGAYGMRESIDNFGMLLAAARRTGARVFVTFHSFPPQRRLSLGTVRSALRDTLVHSRWKRAITGHFRGSGAARAIAPARILRRALADSGIPAEAIAVVPQGVPAGGAPTRREEWRAELGYAPDDRLLVIFGFVAGYKGHGVAVAAMKALPRRFKLAIVGDVHPRANDLTMDRALRAVRRAKLGDRVRFTGYVPFDLARRYLAAADQCLLPYLDMGLATSAAASWALASGAPVVASRIGAFEELNEDSGALHMVTPGAPEELARAIQVLDGDSALRHRLVAAAAAHVERNGWDRVGAAHLDLYFPGREIRVPRVIDRPAPALTPGG